MTAEILKYTREQVEALELAPGTEHQSSRAGFRNWRRTRICVRLLKRRLTIAAT